MWLFRSITITRKLFLVSTAVAMALVAASALAVREMQDVVARAQQIENTRTPQLGRADQAELDVTRASLLLRHAMLARTPQERAQALQDVQARSSHLDETLKRYADSITTPAGRQVFQAIPQQTEIFKQHAVECVRLIESGDQGVAFAFLADKLVPVRNELLASLAQIKVHEGKLLDTEVLDISKAVQRTMLTVIASAVAVIGGLFATCIMVGATLRGRARRASKIVNRVRDFDLRHEIKDQRNDEFSGLMAAMNEMQDALAKVVSEVRSNAQQVASASADIAHGNQDLSARTEEQAGNLQQTASAMDQLGTTVRQNAGSASQASELAQGASQVAQRGGVVVGQVVQAMGEISNSSRQIGDIIGVIDSIAFQTNILALNAAVEAARAGEAGRGFAVVASEVRQLAQRSAEAAREIKQLISTSIEKISHGASQAQIAGSTMNEVVEAIRHVTVLVGEIANASREQADGVQFAAQSLQQMDGGTQQNAALVEQSAAAADGLKRQAQALLTAVSTFKIDDAEVDTSADSPRLQWAGR